MAVAATSWQPACRGEGRGGFGQSPAVDYVMTITISIAACGDAVFSYIPWGFHTNKVPVACILTVITPIRVRT